MNEELEPIRDATSFRRELVNLINLHSMENGSDTPDFILAEYLLSCLENFDNTSNMRKIWYSGRGSGKGDETKTG